MHELTVAASLLDALLEAAAHEDATAVVRARVRIGALSCIQEEALRFGFGALARGTIAAGCELEVVHAPARGECAGCGWTGEVTDPILFPCPRCGAVPVRTAEGRDLVLESASLETP